jgi:phage/plasmid-associated DNA primase
MDIEERLEVLSNNVGWLYRILSEITARIIHKAIKIAEKMATDEEELRQAIREIEREFSLENLKTNEKVKIVAHAVDKLDLLNFVLVWYEDNSRLIGLNDKGLLIENAEDILKRYSTSIFGEWINEYVKREIKDMIKIKVIDAKEIKLNAEKYIRVNNAIIDLKTLELLEPNNDIIFFSKLDIDIEPTIIHRIREYPINELEQYFKDNPFELTFRRFYEQENWEKLRILLGTIFSDATKILIIIHGGTDTFKTTLVNTVANVLGSLCMKINFRDMEKERFPFQGITYETRLVVDSEFSDIVMTKRAIELAKQLFGGDNLRIERKNRPPFYRQINTIKGLTATNKLPIFESLDDAFLSRLYLIPTHKPEDFTPNPDIRFENEVLKDKKLREEIFYYLLYCYRLYKENPNRLYGLHDINETREILIEGSYPLKRWEDADPKRVIKDENAKEKLIDLWNDFIEWRKTLPLNDEDFDRMNQISSEKFKRLLESRYQKIIHGGRIWFKGIGLKNKQNTLTS